MMMIVGLFLFVVLLLLIGYIGELIAGRKEHEANEDETEETELQPLHEDLE